MEMNAVATPVPTDPELAELGALQSGLDDDVSLGLKGRESALPLLTTDYESHGPPQQKLAHQADEAVAHDRATNGMGTSRDDETFRALVSAPTPSQDDIEDSMVRRIQKLEAHMDEYLATAPASYSVPPHLQSFTQAYVLGLLPVHSLAEPALAKVLSNAGLTARRIPSIARAPDLPSAIELLDRTYRHLFEPVFREAPCHCCHCWEMILSLAATFIHEERFGSTGARQKWIGHVRALLDKNGWPVFHIVHKISIPIEKTIGEISSGCNFWLDDYLGTSANNFATLGPNAVYGPISLILKEESLRPNQGGYGSHLLVNAATHFHNSTFSRLRPYLSRGEDGQAWPGCRKRPGSSEFVAEMVQEHLLPGVGSSGLISKEIVCQAYHARCADHSVAELAKFSEVMLEIEPEDERGIMCAVCGSAYIFDANFCSNCGLKRVSPLEQKFVTALENARLSRSDFDSNAHMLRLDCTDATGRSLPYTKRQSYVTIEDLCRSASELWRDLMLTPAFPISCRFKPKMVISGTSAFPSTSPASLRPEAVGRSADMECRLRRDHADGYGDHACYEAHMEDVDASIRDTMPMHALDMSPVDSIRWYEEAGTHQRVEVLLPSFVPIDQILCAVVACKLSPDVCSALQAAVPHVVFVESEEASHDFQVRLFRERARCHYPDFAKSLPRSIADATVAAVPPNTAPKARSDAVCELVDADGSTHLASCAILTNASPYFKAAFSSGLKEATSLRFQVDAPSWAVEAVLLYQSKGKFEGIRTIGQVLEVSKLAGYWELDALSRSCLALHADLLHSNNVIANGSGSGEPNRIGRTYFS